MKSYSPTGISFESLAGGDFKISLQCVSFGHVAPDGTVHSLDSEVHAKASELVGLDFLQVVSLFRERINAAFEVRP